MDVSVIDINTRERAGARAGDGEQWAPIRGAIFDFTSRVLRAPIRGGSGPVIMRSWEV